MPSYKALDKLFYEDRSANRQVHNEAQARLRLESPSTFRTGIMLETGELFFAMPQELTLLNERALRVERKVSLLWNALPGIAQWSYIRSLIMDEIVSSNEIEGVHSTRRQIEEALKNVESSNPSKKEKQFQEFAQLYLGLMDKNIGYPEKPEDIRLIFDAVTNGQLAKNYIPDGELFRKGPVDVESSTQKILHTGVLPERKIIDLLQQMIEMVQSKDIPPTFSALLSHFLFEYIHPFYDGNGRTGRYLLALALSIPLSQVTVFSLSKVIAENKNKYYKAFDVTENPLNHAEGTVFIIEMMKLIRLAQDMQIEDISQKQELLDEADKMTSKLGEPPYSLSAKSRDILYQAVQYHLFSAFPEVSLIHIAKYIEAGSQTARKYTLELQEKELLTAVSLKPLQFVLTDKAQKLLGLK